MMKDVLTERRLKGLLRRLSIQVFGQHTHLVSKIKDALAPIGPTSEPLVQSADKNPSAISREHHGGSE